MYDLARMGSPTTSKSDVSGGKILTLRMGKAKAGPVVSDNGNFIVDAPFPKDMMKDPKAVSQNRTAGSIWTFSGFFFRARADPLRTRGACCSC